MFVKRVAVGRCVMQLVSYKRKSDRLWLAGQSWQVPLQFFWLDQYSHHRLLQSVCRCIAQTLRECLERCDLIMKETRV